MKFERTTKLKYYDFAKTSHFLKKLARYISDVGFLIRFCIMIEKMSIHLTSIFSKHAHNYIIFYEKIIIIKDIKVFNRINKSSKNNKCIILLGKDNFHLKEKLILNNDQTILPFPAEFAELNETISEYKKLGKIIPCNTTPKISLNPNQTLFIAYNKKIFL